MAHNELTIATILRQLAEHFDAPVAERQVLNEVLLHRPSSAKNPYAAIRERLRWDGLSLGWLRLSRRELVPLRLVLNGLRFRCVPRAQDITAGVLPLPHLQPFVGLRTQVAVLRDSRNQEYALDEGAGEVVHSLRFTPCFRLASWYRAEQFAVGDSMLVTVEDSAAMRLRIEREPAAAFRHDAVVAQDTELLTMMLQRVHNSQLALLPCDELILPIFAQAAWRSAYPGTAWQLLLRQDGRLQLVDDIFVTNQRHAALHFTSDDDIFPFDRDEQAVADEVEDAALLGEIEALQAELRNSRQHDAEAGIWSGQIQRASAAYTLFDRAHYDDMPGGVFFADIELSVDGDGLIDGSDWLFDEWDAVTEDHLDTASLLDTPLSFSEAQARMMAALPPDVIQRLNNASPEEAEVIIASQLNHLLVSDLALFPRLDLSKEGKNNESFDADTLFEGDWLDSDSDGDEWEPEWGDDLIDELDDEIISEMGVYTHSTDLINRFHDYLRETGKSARTAQLRTRQLLVYAEFLASYYERALDEGDYATLDECLFFYYPRRVVHTSPRQVRDICVAIKQFYHYLKQHGEIADDHFAVAQWRRRDQAARVVELYERISSESPNFELLFTRLFEPYTEE
jgi:hypothetical protein